MVADNQGFIGVEDIAVTRTRYVERRALKSGSPHLQEER